MILFLRRKFFLFMLNRVQYYSGSWGCKDGGLWPIQKFLSTKWTKNIGKKMWCYACSSMNKNFNYLNFLALSLNVPLKLVIPSSITWNHDISLANLIASMVAINYLHRGWIFIITLMHTQCCYYCSPCIHMTTLGLP